MNAWNPVDIQRGLVTIVLPAKNEGVGIRRTLRMLPFPTLRAMGFEHEIFVLDGNSRDATTLFARRWGAQVVTDQEPGKGNALRRAIPMFRGEYVVMLDADATYSSDAIPPLLAILRRGEADVVMGRRRPQPGSMPEAHLVGNKLLSMGASVLYLRYCPDVCTGLWGFRAEALRSMPLQSRGFGLEAELFAMSARMRMRVARVDVDYLPRHGPTKLQSGVDGVRILKRLLTTRIAPLYPRSPTSVGAPSPQPAPVEVRA
jgi:dolichol-phosphate mannosyltransferase